MKHWQTNRYAISVKINQGFKIYVDEFYNIYFTHDFWSETDNLGIKLVKNTTSRNAYLQLKSLIHFQNNFKPEHNTDDR